MAHIEAEIVGCKNEGAGKVSVAWKLEPAADAAWQAELDKKRPAELKDLRVTAETLSLEAYADVAEKRIELVHQLVKTVNGAFAPKKGFQQATFDANALATEIL